MGSKAGNGECFSPSASETGAGLGEQLNWRPGSAGSCSLLHLLPRPGRQAFVSLQLACEGFGRTKGPVVPAVVGARAWHTDDRGLILTHTVI
ncbi:hypothetical protein AAFF_G00051910 [Aldrovandia affinis]|uniref:Uncharacterized protein n=1 Tax=Aldrovandia affinis TaxID=143900 RepID=A0AAD7T6A4_9TELE|nr:hypothetical protein AAFF_G00051910 [Aldrovandia affinis]